MGFRKDGFCRVFKVEDKGNYSVAEISTSKKNKDTDKYETDWSNKFVRLVGTAHNQLKKMTVGDKGITLKIGDCDVTNNYDKEKKITYTNYVIFNFHEDEGNSGSSKPSANSKPKNEPMDDDESDQLPF